ncbi:hypothetical protein QC762_0050160 [Podospora pseudocomata]|uniref:Uncharacterized protein n=1 Tax=Podospora pseudocomata TaxID=2093779 RepID=A0ABR0GII0_9PEZI|nr:hypothetical protein QC762_0050160 [Podospora pseudocomata]
MAIDCLFTPAHHLGTFELMKCDIRTDQAVGPHPPILRGLRHVADALKAAGQKVVDWEPPLQTTTKRVHVSFLLADDGNDIHPHLVLSGEPLIPDLQEPFQLKAAN